MTLQRAELLDFQGKRFSISEEPLRAWLSENAEHIRFNHIDVSKFLPKRKSKSKAESQGHTQVKNEDGSEGTIKPLRFRVFDPFQGAFPFRFTNTACYRGYQGTWTIDGDRLYLTRIDGTLVDGRVATLADLFPDEPDRVFAHWFSGEIHDDSVRQWISPSVIRVNHGDSENKIDQGLNLLLRFEKGLLIGQGAQSANAQPTAPDKSGAAEPKQ